MTFSIPFLSLLFFSLEQRSQTKTPERMMSFFFPRYRGQKHERRRRFQKGRFLVRAFLAKKSDASGRVYAHITREVFFFLSAFSSSFCHRVFSLSPMCLDPTKKLSKTKTKAKTRTLFSTASSSNAVVVEEASVVFFPFSTLKASFRRRPLCTTRSIPIQLIRMS